MHRHVGGGRCRGELIGAVDDQHQERREDRALVAGLAAAQRTWRSRPARLSSGSSTATRPASIASTSPTPPSWPTAAASGGRTTPTTPPTSPAAWRAASVRWASSPMRPLMQLRKLGRHWRQLSRLLSRSKHAMKSMLNAANLHGPKFDGAGAQRWLLAHGHLLQAGPTTGLRRLPGHRAAGRTASRTIAARDPHGGSHPKVSPRRSSCCRSCPASATSGA